MWRWFVTRFEELETSTPHDKEGNFFLGRMEPPVSAQQVLGTRIEALVTLQVLGSLVSTLQAKAGDAWAKVELNKLSS